MKDETYGQQVRRLRKARKWSQPDLHKHSGVPVRTIQDIEADKPDKPHRGTVLALNRALDIAGDPVAERRTWPEDVQVILDIVGAYLMTMEPSDRIRWMSTVTLTPAADR